MESDRTMIMDQTVTAIARDRGGKYLTFSLAGEKPGTGIREVKEIIGIMPVTSWPITERRS